MVLLKRRVPFKVDRLKQNAFNQEMPSWSCAFWILAAIAVTCAPVVASDYGFSDDFWILSIRPLNSEIINNTLHHFNAEGRSIFSVWVLGVMGQASGIQDLRFVRLLTLFGLFFSSVVFYKLLRRHLAEDRIDALLTACIFSINPSFLIMAGWASIGCDSYACLLGLLSSHALLLDARFDAPSSKSEGESRGASIIGSGWGCLFGSALLLFAALFLYQPGAMLYWTGAAIWIIGRFTAKREDWMKLARITAVFIVVLGVYFLFASTLAGPNSRFHVSISLIRRMGWFMLYPLQNALSYPSIQPLTFWSIATLLILSFGVWSFCRQTSRTLWIPSLVLMITPLTVLPTIFAYGHYDTSRTREALYGLIIILWYVVFGTIVRYLKDAFKLRHILIPILIVLIMSGQYHLQRYLITPELREESALLVKLQEYVRENPKLDRLIVIWPPPTNPPTAEFHGVDEMGITSLNRPLGSYYVIRLILAGVTNRNYEDLLKAEIPPIDSYDLRAQANQTPPPDAFIIDFRQSRAPR